MFIPKPWLEYFFKIIFVIDRFLFHYIIIVKEFGISLFLVYTSGMCHSSWAVSASGSLEKNYRESAPCRECSSQHHPSENRQKEGGECSVLHRLHKWLGTMPGWVRKKQWNFWGYIIKISRLYYINYIYSVTVYVLEINI